MGNPVGRRDAPSGAAGSGASDADAVTPSAERAEEGTGGRPAAKRGVASDIPALRRFGDGSGEPALLLHCSLAHSGAWSEVARRLTGLLDMTAMDAPGHGRSPPWDPARDFHDQATAMARAALTRAAPADAPAVHLIGHSFGATVALRLALEGGCARSLTLVEPVLFAAARQAGDPAHAEHVRAFEPVLAAFEAGDRERAARIFSDAWGGQPWEALPDSLRAYQSERIDLILAGTPALEDDARRSPHARR